MRCARLSPDARAPPGIGGAGTRFTRHTHTTALSIRLLYSDVHNGGRGGAESRREGGLLCCGREWGDRVGAKDVVTRKMQEGTQDLE